ncbi:hypothetical protein CDL15_Pgr022666 [Punica granatum]|uniref:Uncharacterized protein n=1 Tax=Punica granatum TaxID=22663 RepID=A0A218XRJ2_PUNGR|nr:hypothetical protein CDL15_Pgr022666 [Punica granatum]PKI74650.1 hypothetical protein CRG98_004977 [Punica granatum]
MPLVSNSRSSPSLSFVVVVSYSSSSTLWLSAQAYGFQHIEEGFGPGRKEHQRSGQRVPLTSSAESIPKVPKPSQVEL